MSHNGEHYELTSEMLSMHGLTPFCVHDSASRKYMFGSHITQHLVIEGSEEDIIQSGLEQEFGKYTFNIKAPNNGKIIRVIERYPKGIGEDIPSNPELIVIYQTEQGEYDYFSIPRYCCNHQYFGFPYKHNEVNMEGLREGTNIIKDTIYADSPAVKANHNYTYGANFNVALMSIPAISEDGVVISKSAAKRLSYEIYETRVVEFGKTHFPLNTYGNRTFYKPFPDIGERIKEDGTIMVLRKFEESLAPVDMSIDDAMMPDFIFDKATYARGGDGVVIDIKVIANRYANKNLSPAMCGHIDKYKNAYERYNRAIIDTYEKLVADNKKMYGEAKLKISPKFHSLVTTAMAILDHSRNQIKALSLIYKRADLDEYRVEFTIAYKMNVSVGE